jgi:hypothetical protein
MDPGLVRLPKTHLLIHVKDASSLLYGDKTGSSATLKSPAMDPMAKASIALPRPEEAWLAAG